MSVLIALDDSPIAEEVLSAVAPQLRRTRTPAHLVRMVDPGEVRDAAVGSGPGAAPTPAGDLSGGRVPVGAGAAHAGVTRSQAIQQVVDEHTASLRHLAHEHLEGVESSFHVDIADDAAAAVVALADELGVESIAIGTRGRGGIRRALMGSVAEAVIRHANVPVLVVRHGMSSPAGD